MNDIRMYSFAVLEAALYLDTHPRSRCALEYYEKYNALLEDAKAEYSNMVDYSLKKAIEL